MYVVATVLIVPGTILTRAAGVLFELGVGAVTVSTGSRLEVSLAFVISRYVARTRLPQWHAGIAVLARLIGPSAKEAETSWPYRSTCETTCMA